MIINYNYYHKDYNYYYKAVEDLRPFHLLRKIRLSITSKFRPMMCYILTTTARKKNMSFIDTHTGILHL